MSKQNSIAITLKNVAFIAFCETFHRCIILDEKNCNRLHRGTDSTKGPPHYQKPIEKSEVEPKFLSTVQI